MTLFYPWIKYISLDCQTQTQEVGKLQQQLDQAENELIKLKMTVQKEQEARRVAEEVGVGIAIADHKLNIYL